jgi:hypothetical protein
VMPANGRVRLVVLGGLVAGGIAGAGVGLGWYSPVVGVGLAVLVGLGVATQVRLARRSKGEGARSTE